MARRRVKSLEQESAADLITLLLRERINRIQLDPSGLAMTIESHIKRVISHVLLWKHSEAGGHKYKGCRYWTQSAHESQEEPLIHEHLFPRKQLIELLFEMENPTVAEVSEVLDRLNIAVVVTLKQDKSLPSIGCSVNPWNRYKGVWILDREKNRLFLC